MGLDVGKLGDHVFAHHGLDLGLRAEMVAGFVYHSCGIGVAQPAGHCGHVVQAFAGGDGRHGTAIGMAADDDVGNLQGRHGVFHRGRYASRLGAVGRHDVACIADDEQVSGFTLGDQLRHQAAVGA